MTICGMLQETGLKARGRWFVSGSALAIMICSPTAAWAQDTKAPPAEESNDTGIGEIIVTAQKREQRLQDVPVSITALGGDDLEANRVKTARDLDALVPNLMVRQQFGASGLPLYTLRGSLASASAPGADRGVAVYIDGVYLNAASGSLFEMAEIERIEVLRGPQGTLFGRNSTGGAISFVTRAPSNDFGVKQSVTVGNFNQLRSQTTLHTGLIGPFSASISYLHSEQRGDIRNLGAGTVWDFSPAFADGRTLKFTSPKWLGDNNADAVKVAVKFEPSDTFKAIYRFDWSDNNLSSEGVGVAYARPNVRALLATQSPALTTPTTRNRPDAVNNGALLPSNIRASGHSLTLELEVSDSLTLKNVAAYRQTSFSAPMTDLAGTGVITNTGGPAFVAVLGSALAASTIGEPLLIQSTISSTRDRQISNEFQLNYDSELVTVTAGAIYFRNKHRRATIGDGGLGGARSGAFRIYPGFRIPFSGQLAGTGGLPSEVTTKSYAAFGQAEFHVTPQLDVIGGIRYTKDEKSGIDRTNFSAASAIILPISYKGSKVTYSLGANYKITSDIMVYGKFSTGFISGGALAGIEFVPETAKSWEGGVKADWFDNRLRTNLAVFDVAYGNIQSGIGGGNLNPPRPDVPLAIINVGSSKARGFELETEFAPVKGFSASAAVGYTDFRYTSLSPSLTAINAEILPQSRPKWTLNLGAQYESEPLFDEVKLTARIDGNWRSQFFAVLGVPLTSAAFSAVEQAAFKDAIRIDPYWLVNARIGLDGFKFGGADVRVALWAKNLFDEDTPSYALSITNIVGYQYERARTFGVDLEVKF